MTSSDSWTARPPINSRLTAAEAVLADLRAAIEKGDLAVGVRLPSEAAMATRYQVSRSVVREALRSAETLGLTRTQTGRGTFVVSDRPAHDLRIGQFSSRDLVEARPHFEVPAAGLAAQRRTEEHCAELRRLVQAMDHTTDQRQWVEHDAAFHGQIATASGNAVFAAVAESVRDALIRQSETLNIAAHRRRSSNAEHRAILDAIEAADPDAAGNAMDEHLRAVGEAVVQLLDGAD
jgi:DNA-binding FadR family transcriptional regulator